MKYSKKNFKTKLKTKKTKKKKNPKKIYLGGRRNKNRINIKSNSKLIQFIMTKPP